MIIMKTEHTLLLQFFLMSESAFSYDVVVVVVVVVFTFGCNSVVKEIKSYLAWVEEHWLLCRRLSGQKVGWSSPRLNQQGFNPLNPKSD